MKRILLGSCAILLTGSVLAGCSGKEETKSGGDAAPKPNKEVTIKIMNFKVEIVEQFNKLKDEYEKTHPGVKLQIDTLFDDYPTGLKARFAANDMPDIFNNGGYQELDTWVEHLEDLSDQPWVKDVLDVAKEPTAKGGKVYGMPVNLEGLGFLYNKDLFAKAGITELPKTLSQLEETAKKLQAVGIAPFINNFDSWFGLGYHMFNNPMAKQPNPNEFIQGLYNGTATFTGNAVFADWTKLFDLNIKYGNSNALTTDYNNATSQFATGKAAMIQSGNWIQPIINKLNPDLKVGILPMPINDDAALNDKIFVGVPNNWVVNKDSAVKEEAKQFLNWLVTSETGKRYLTKEFGFIPAFKSIKAKPADIGSIGEDITKYIEQGKVLGWHWAKLPEGAAPEFGASMQKYIAGKINRDQMLAEFQSSWDKVKAKK
ncbi:ABC transporter substrate-binding protein [Paenibacillus sp. GCM10027628]|uniref:ABC transporter substrate-binding protein n=1 Tax=Paenibacillus sp. GCM10027628 TaxID=3273413 RepID=UPI00362A7426